MVKTSESVYDNLDFNCNCLKQWKDTHTEAKIQKRKQLRATFYLQRRLCSSAKLIESKTGKTHTFRNCDIFFVFDTERKEEITAALDAIYHKQDMGSSGEVFVLCESHINHLSPCVGCKPGACSAAWQKETQGGGNGMTGCPALAHTLAGMIVCGVGRRERKESVLALLLHCWIKIVTYPSSTSKSLLIFRHNWHFTAFCCPSCLNINASNGSDDCSHPEQRIRN